MVSLARANLIFEWRRYLAAVLAVTFAGLLVVVQLALLLGLFGSVSVVIDQSAADLWLGFHNTLSVDLGRPINQTSDARAWVHPGIERIERYVGATGDLRGGNGVPLLVYLHAIDTSSEALAFRKLLSVQERTLLREPNAIFVDPADIGKLNATVGTTVEINHKRAYIAGVVEGLRAVGGVNVITSFATTRTLAPETAEQVVYYLIRLRPGFDPHVVAREIADKNLHPQYSVWPAQDFSIRSQTYWLFESGAGIGAGFASLLALIVGIVITSQTLSGAILASIKEFAAVRALGVPLRALRAIVIEQSLWVGAIGLAITGMLTAMIAWQANQWHIAMVFPWWMLVGVAALMIGIALLSGLLALRPLLHAEPASLLR